MKQKLLFLVLLAAGLLTVTVAGAQTWTASEPADGTFYLYNVGNAGFMRGANDWSTRASLTRQGGIPVSLRASSSSGYYISTSPTYNGLYLGSDGYVDKSTSAGEYTAWNFIAVDGEEKTYKLQAKTTSKYIFGHASDDTKTTVNSTLPDNTKAYWKLVTKEALLASFENASEENPVDATFLVADPYFGRVTKPGELWSGDSFWAHGGYENAASQNYAVEMWNKTYDSYQELTNVPNGVYKLTVQGFYRVGDGVNDATKAGAARAAGNEVLNAKYYLNEAEGTLMSIFDSELTASYNSEYNTSAAININGTNYYVPNNLSRAARAFMLGEYVNAPVKAIVTDGNLRLGVRKTVTNSNDWAAWDNITLTYYGVDLTALVENYEDLLATAKSLQSAAMQATVKSALDEAVTAAETNVNTSSQTWLETNISALSTAIMNAQVSNALYTGDILTAVNHIKAQSTSDDVKAAVQQKYDDGEYTAVADVYVAYQALEIAALGTDANTDYTSVLINPGFEMGSTDGWTIQTRGTDTGAHHTNNATYEYSGTEGDYLFNTWANYVATLDIGQTVTGLPRGYYTLSAVVASYGDGAAITMVAGSRNASVSPTNSNVDAEVKVGHTLTIENIFVADGTLTFTLQNTGKGYTLLKADAFHLTLTEPYTPLDSYTDVALTASLENDEVARYLANTTYTTSTASVIGSYATDAALRNDQPAAVQIPVPLQDVDATLSVSLSSDYTAAQTFTVAAGSVVYDVVNLMPQHTYYYKVVADDVVVTNGTITTTGRLRMVKADGIANMRDLGGWLNADGNRIRYGKLFRGTELRGGRNYTASDADLTMLKDELGIGAEVDLRSDADFASGTMNASAVDGATYYYANLTRWSEDALNFDAAKFKSAFDLVLAALKADKAAYFHCIYGADRTGCFAFLLEGLLGLPVDQLYKDYELTSFSSVGLRSKDGIDHKIQYISALQGETLQEKFYNYWRGAVGVSESDLNDFINLMVEGTSPITTAELAALPTKQVEDGEYYIYLPTKEKFLGRGRGYGTQGVPDNYGVPATITTNGANVTTIQFLDNNLFLGSDGYTDKAASYNTASWFVESYGGHLVLKSHNGNYLQIYEGSTGSRVRVENAAVAEAIPVEFKTAAQQKAIVAAVQEANILAAAEAAGIEAADLSTFNFQLSTNYTAVASSVTLDATSKTGWTLNEANNHGETANYGNAYNVGTYGGEFYQKNATLSQTVTVPHSGLYKLTLNAYYRQGSNANCYTVGQKGYEMSNAYVSVNDTYFAQIPSWYSDATASNYPNNTGEAKALVDAGKYAMEVYAYIDESCQATIAVNVPSFTSLGWCLFSNFALTEYAKNVTIDENAFEAPAAEDFANVTLTRSITEGFNTLCLPFSLTEEQVQAAFGSDVKVYTLSGETAVTEDSYTLNFTEGTALAANTPAIISGVTTEKAGNSYTFTGVTIVPEAMPKASTDHFEFIGTYTAGTVPEGDYFLRKGSSEIVRSVGNTMKGFRAYIAPKAESEVKSFMLFFDNADSIDLVNNRENVNNQIVKCYDLSGRHVAGRQLPAGIYVKDGRKVVVK